MSITVKKLGVTVNETFVTTGVVEDPERGFIRLGEEVDGKWSLLSVQAQRFPAGRQVELKFRVMADKKKQLVQLTPILETDRWDLTMVSMVPEGWDVDPFWEIVHTSEGAIVHPISSTFPFTWVEGLQYPGYSALRKWVMSRSPEFIDAVKFTKYSVEGVTQPIEVPGLELREARDPIDTDFERGGWVNGFWVEPDARPLFGIVHRLTEAGECFNMLALGPSGYGKTSLFKALAEYLGYAFLRVDCAKVTDTQAWFGTHEAREGSTYFVPSDFTEAITRGHVVVVLDEANRIEPWIQNSLFPLLDDARQTVVHGLEIKVGPGVVFGLTMNVGVKYAGTFVVDQAFMNRVDATIEVDAPSMDVERKIVARRYGDLEAKVINEVTLTMKHLREVAKVENMDVDVSTRTTLKVARLLLFGLDLREALTYVVINAASTEERKAIIDKINLGR